MLQSSNCSSVEHSNSLGNLPRGKLRILNIVASLDPVRVFSHEIFRDYKLEKLTRRKTPRDTGYGCSANGYKLYSPSDFHRRHPRYPLNIGY